MLFSKKSSPYLALALGVLCLSFSAIFVRIAEAPGIVTSFYRMTTAVIILIPIMLVRSKGKINFDKRWLLAPLAAGFFTALDHATWSTAVAHTSIANANLINFIAPVWVALVSWIFWKQKLPTWFWIGLIFVLTGMTFVFGSNLLLHPGFSKGDSLALLSSFFFAGYYLTTQKARARVDALTSTTIIAMVSAVTLLIICLVSKAPLTGFPSSTWTLFIISGLVSQIGGYFSMTYALGHIPASIVSPTMIASPVIAAILAIPIAGEGLSIYQIIGGLLVFAGIYLVNKTHAAKSISLPVHSETG
ncbi:MAG: DMT family transporter [Leptolinea sp.]